MFGRGLGRSVPPPEEAEVGRGEPCLVVSTNRTEDSTLIRRVGLAQLGVAEDEIDGPQLVGPVVHDNPDAVSALHRGAGRHEVGRVDEQILPRLPVVVPAELPAGQADPLQLGHDVFASGPRVSRQSAVLRPGLGVVDEAVIPGPELAGGVETLLGRAVLWDSADQFRRAAGRKG